MIKIKVDPYELSNIDSKAFIVKDESQFIESRLKIRDKLYKRKNLIVIIKNRKIGQWYESLKDYQDVNIENISPSSVLSQELNIQTSQTLNLLIDDSEIMELGLIEKAKKYPPQIRLSTVEDMECWILSVCVDESWGKKEGTLSHLSEIASFFLRNEKYQKNHSLEKLMETQKEKWFNSSRGDAYKWLFASTNDRAFLIYVCQILKNYDLSMMEKILDEITGRNRKIIEPIEIYLERIPPCECNNGYKKNVEFSDLLEIKWKNILKSKFEYKKSEIKTKKHDILKGRFKKIINEAIPQMSGKIAGEINALIDFIKKEKLNFNKELFYLISAKFNSFPKQLEELKQLIPPIFPSRPFLNWDWNKMSKWVIDEYLPYKKWSIQQDVDNKKIEDIAKTYSEWLYIQYPKLKNELSPLIYGTWYNIKKYIEQGYQILWLIIDNLCWFYMEDIIKAFKEQGIFLANKPKPCLSMLPSETRISKTALVAGKLPDQIDTDKFQNYKQLFEEFCKMENILSYRIISPYKIEKVFNKEKIGNQIVTCGMLMNPDISAHRDFYGLERYMKSFFSNIAEDIKNFISPYPSKQFLLIISTDHGSCIIPENIKGLTKPNCSKEESKYKRFVFIDSCDNLNENWYFLDKDIFSLPEHTAIAKGYRFIGNRKPRGWVHGGMTPEETFVPHLEFCLQPLEIKAIKFFHNSHPIISIRKQKVEILIQNLNDFEISKVFLYIPSHSIEINIERIPPKDEVNISCEITLSREEIVESKNNIVFLKGFYSFYCMGEQKSDEIKLDFKIRKIVEGTDTADEIFKVLKSE